MRSTPDNKKGKERGIMNESKFRAFDAAEFLDNEEVIAAYLSEARKDPDPDAMREAISTVERARGMAKDRELRKNQ